MTTPVVIVTGGVLGSPSGVEDYSACLAGALQANDARVRLESRNLLCFRDWFSAMRSLHSEGVIHLQYPSLGFGRALYAQLLMVALSISKKIVVTIHEFKRAHWLRRLSILPFALVARKLIFTSHAELTAARRWYPWIGLKASVIPIASNIPRSSEPKDPNLIAFFGLIEPRKGLEDFLEFARLVSGHHKRAAFEVIGTPTSRARAFYEDLRRRCALPIQWTCAASPTQVAQRLARATWAYLPYPDGVSERRGSLLAALENEVLVLTTPGPDTTDELRACCHIVGRPQEAAETFSRVFGAQQGPTKSAARRYLGHRQWPAIAKAHADLYATLGPIVP